MNLAKTVKNRIEEIGAGRIFTYDDFADLNAFQTVALNLSRLSQQGVIQRLSKGKYYKPKKTKFGELKPSESEILKTILAKNGGYIAGVSTLNRMGISTQVPSEIVISGSRSIRKIKIANLRLKFVKGLQFNSNLDNQILSDIIEVLKAFKSIGRNEKETAIRKVTNAISKLNYNEKSDLVGLALQSRPYVRALLGTLLDIVDQDKMLIGQIRKSLNPISIYKIADVVEILPISKNWKIQ